MKNLVLALTLVFTLTSSTYAGKPLSKWEKILIPGALVSLVGCIGVIKNLKEPTPNRAAVITCAAGMGLAMGLLYFNDYLNSKEDAANSLTPESYDLALSQMESTQVLSTVDREDMAYALYEEQEPEKVAEDYFENPEQQAAFLSELDQMGEAIVTALAENNAS